MPPKRKLKTTKTSTPRRQSTRRKVLPTKSPYFEHPSENEDNEEQSDTGSDFEEAKGDVDTAPGDGDEGFDEEEEEEEKPARPSKKRGSKSSNAAVSRSKPVNKKKKENGEVFIPFRAPSAGEIDYADDQIHPSTLMFLAGVLIELWIRMSDRWY
jgi:hypothetical protein